MAWFIIEMVIMISLAGIIYLLARALPRISDEAVNGPESHSQLMFYVEKLDDVFKTILERLLRQSKVWILKVDNFVSQKLSRFKKEAPKENKLPVVEEKEKSE